MPRRLLSAALVVSVLAGIAAITPTVYARTIETPRYSVEAAATAEASGFEIRRYEPRLVAEVEVQGDPERATNAGFRILADFIFGNNTAEAEIAMTAPVEQTRSEAIAMTAPVDRTASADQPDTWVVAFTMPAKYTRESLPKPNNAEVKIREIPGKRYAVVRFNGAPREAVVAQRMADLIVAVDAAGLQRTGAPPTYARYDPPWTLGLLRRNEIFVELVAAP
jgi:effector-binding domain-containing protein